MTGSTALHFDWLGFSLMVSVCCKKKLPRRDVRTTLICGYKDKCLDCIRDYLCWPSGGGRFSSKSVAS